MLIFAQFLLTALNQIWEAQGRATALGQGLTLTRPISLLWPVAGNLGWVSARFHDSTYEHIFGFPHDGVDIAVPKGTVVRSMAAGHVGDVTDNGMGFNSVTVVHDDGSVALFGHVSDFLVIEGQRVAAGDPLAHSGGRPGDPGSGPYSTGEHVHVSLRVNGATVDPLLSIRTPDLF